MVRHRSVALAAAAGLLAMAAAARAQQPAQTVPLQATGSVSGTVIAQDTQRPARFAQVELQSVASAAASGSNNQRGGFAGGFNAGGVQTRSEADGTFLATGLAPGDYYVTAWATGYIAERALLQAEVNAGADAGALLASIPVVHVSADATSTVNVSLVRGGSLSGHVQWEDGSPAAGVSVTALSTTANTPLPDALQAIRSPGQQTATLTDDRGVFRLSGLATGSYLLEITLQGRVQFGGFARGGPQFNSPVHIYAPGVFRRSQGKPVALRAGEERTDLSVVLDLRGLHTVTGTAVSSNPGQAVASGRVSLTDPADSSLQVQGTVQPDGSFTLRYVPPGSYTLQISGAGSRSFSFGRGRGGETSSGTAVSYQQASEAVTVTDTDLSGVSITLTPVAAPASTP